jgi:hypothetical protein
MDTGNGAELIRMLLVRTLPTRKCHTGMDTPNVHVLIPRQQQGQGIGMPSETLNKKESNDLAQLGTVVYTEQENS